MKQGWQIYKLEDICTIYDKLRKPISKKDRVSGIYPYYGASCVQDYVNDYLFDGRYVLIGEDGAKWGSGEDTAYIVEGKFWVNNHAHIIQCNNGIVDTFIYYYFNHLDLTKLVAGAIIPKLTQETLRSMEIPIPPLPEQQRIVSLLDAEFAKIDALKANAEKNLQNAKDLFQAALKKELEPKKGWKSMLLGDFAKMKAGDFIKASDIHSDYYEGSFPCYGGNGLRGYVDVPNKEGEYCLIGRQGALCGNVHIANGVFRATEHAVVVEPYFSMPIKLVYYLLTALNLNKYSTGAAQPGLSVKNIAEKAMISIPPEEKYSIIAATLDGLSVRTQALQANYEKTLSLCDDLKQALLRKAFNGEI